jgi:hypothetical protein
MTPLQKLDQQLDLAIAAQIGLYAQTGQLTRKMLIPLTDIGVERITLKLRQNVANRGKSLKMELKYDPLTRAFHFTVDLNHVTMTRDQAQAFVEAQEKAPKVA